MINKNDITPIGNLIKPHGIKGEILASLDYDMDLSDVQCVILEMDGIFVPFFIESVRPKSTSSDLIQIEDIDSEIKAKAVCGKELYVLKTDLPESLSESDEGFFTSDLIGFAIYDTDDNRIGEIIDFDDSTDNPLFMVRPVSGDTQNIIYIPVAEDFIEVIDVESRIVTMDLPQGLLDLNT